MKRIVYMLAFTILGAMVGFFIHIMAEVTYLQLLLADFEKYGFGWSWQAWENIQGVGMALLVLFGTGFGYRLGVRCWKWLYVEQKLLKRWGIRLKQTF